jgi:hypothetical protein
MLYMRLKRWAIDQDIIKKHQSTLPQERGQGCVHSSLKGGMGPYQPKGHNSKHKVTHVSLEGSFVFFPRLQ